MPAEKPQASRRMLLCTSSASKGVLITHGSICAPAYPAKAGTCGARSHARPSVLHAEYSKSIWLPVRDVGVLSKGNKLKSATSVRMKWAIERCLHVTCISITFTQGYYDMRSFLNLESKNMSSNPAARNNMIPKPRNDQIKTLKQHVHYR